MAFRNAPRYHQRRGHVLVTPPVVEPVTVAAFFAQAKIADGELSQLDALLIIKQARQYIEEMTGLAFINQTWQLALDNWPGYAEPWWDGVREMAVTELATGAATPVILPRYPLSSISSVKTYDEAGTESVAVIASLFDVDAISRPGRLRPKRGQAWPTATRGLNAVIIEYVAGFGASPQSVPAPLTAAILNLASYFYDHRGECDMSEAFSRSGAELMISSYVSRGF